MGVYDDLDKLKAPATNQSVSPAPAVAPDVHAKAIKEPNVRTSERLNTAPVNRTSERTNGRPQRRSLIRHTFDIYQDQLTALRKLQLEALTLDGSKLALGEMVREALDAYLPYRHKSKRTGELTNDRSSERPNERTDEPWNEAG